MAECGMQIKQSDPNGNNNNEKWIYFITPTFSRPEQIAELTRLGQTLSHVSHLHWIVVEDSTSCSQSVAQLLGRSPLSYTHLTSPMPDFYNNFKHKPKGVAGRRAALTWLRLHLVNYSRAMTKRGKLQPGVFYFGDDDNSFDLRLFDEIRKTKIVSVFPVGLVGDYGFSSPIVRDSKVIGFADSFADSRKFLVDMAGFAVNTNFFLSRPAASMPYLPGHEEDRFLQSLGIEMTDIEPLANDCSQVYVWHTKTKSRDIGLFQLLNNNRFNNTNLKRLFQEVQVMGMTTTVH
jgi:beta-1,3-glucuronyltransferase